MRLCGLVWQQLLHVALLNTRTLCGIVHKLKPATHVLQLLLCADYDIQLTSITVAHLVPAAVVVIQCLQTAVQESVAQFGNSCYISSLLFETYSMQFSYSEKRSSYT